MSFWLVVLVGSQQAVCRTAIPDQANTSAIFDSFGPNSRNQTSLKAKDGTLQNSMKYDIGPESDLTSNLTLKS